MSDEASAWAAGLDLSAEQVAEFARLATAMGSSPAEVLRRMVQRVIEMDQMMRNVGLRGVAGWLTGGDAAEVAAHQGVHGLPLDIRPSSFMWPSEIPFPWTAEECRAAVLGYEVKWKGDFDDFLHRLRGLWEMSDGYAFLRQP